LGVHAKLVPGGRGVYAVSVNGEVVVKKTLMGFPTEQQVTEAVRAALK
jgi:predicted Rdx family selenoprotein